MALFRFGIVLIVTTFLLSGCSFLERWVYRPDINQGNYITQENIDMLKVGQSKEQVLFIMGTPMLNSVYEDNNWHYIFRQLPQHGKLNQITYTIHFDNKGNVDDIKKPSADALNLIKMTEQEPAQDGE